VDVVLERPEVPHVDRAELHEDLRRHSDGLQFADGPEQAQVVVVVGLAAELGGVGEQPDAAELFDHLSVHARELDQIVERVLPIGVGGEEALEAGPVGREHRSDRGEREALGLEIADLLEPAEVLGAVQLVPARPLGRGQELLAGVVADRVHRDAAPLGQLVDPPAGRQIPPPKGRNPVR
jgi:hypothetical protein